MQIMILFPASVKFGGFVLVSLTNFALIIASLVINDWVKGSGWKGSLFKCTSGEYENQQYFSIYCSSPDCLYWNLGKAGVVYTIFSILSLVFLLSWLVFSVNQFCSQSKSEMWVKLFLSLGSCSSYLIGTVLWAGVSGFLASEKMKEECLLGPRLAMAVCSLYMVSVALYLMTFKESPTIISHDNEILEETPSKLQEEIPNMHSIRIEGRFRYPNSVEYEATENIPIS